MSTESITRIHVTDEDGSTFYASPEDVADMAFARAEIAGLDVSQLRADAAAFMANPFGTTTT